MDGCSFRSFVFFLSFPGRALGEGIVPAAGVGVCMWGFLGGLFQDKLGYGESFFFFPLTYDTGTLEIFGGGGGVLTPFLRIGLGGFSLGWNGMYTYHTWVAFGCGACLGR